MNEPDRRRPGGQFPEQPLRPRHPFGREGARAAKRLAQPLQTAGQMSDGAEAVALRQHDPVQRPQHLGHDAHLLIVAGHRPQRNARQHPLQQQHAALPVGGHEAGDTTAVIQPQRVDFVPQLAVGHADLQHQWLAAWPNDRGNVVVGQIREGRQNGQRPVRGHLGHQLRQPGQPFDARLAVDVNDLLGAAGGVNGDMHDSQPVPELGARTLTSFSSRPAKAILAFSTSKWVWMPVQNSTDIPK